MYLIMLQLLICSVSFDKRSIASWWHGNLFICTFTSNVNFCFHMKHTTMVVTWFDIVSIVLRAHAYLVGNVASIRVCYSRSFKIIAISYQVRFTVDNTKFSQRLHVLYLSNEKCEYWWILTGYNSEHDYMQLVCLTKLHFRQHILGSTSMLIPT